MSDETPRELTELTPDQVEGLTRHAEAHVERRQAVKVLPEILLALCHMARRGTRAAKYDELIYAVETKYPNESRHETALRYIRERENPPSSEAKAALNPGAGEETP